MSTVVHRPPPVSSPAVSSAARLVERVRAARRRALLAGALVTTPAVFVGSAIFIALLDLLDPYTATGRELLRWKPAVLALAYLAWTALRVARPPSPRRLALLAEERVPALGNRLATALDFDGEADGPVRRAFLADAERRLASADLRSAVPVRWRAPAAVLAAMLAVAGALAVAFPSAAAEAWTRWAHPRDAYESRWREVRAAALPNVPTPPIPPFDEIRWRVVPPNYAGLRASEGRGEEPLTALPGSRVRLWSRFPERWDAVAASRVSGGALPVRRGGGEFFVEWTVGPQERGVGLEARAGAEVVARRIVPITLLPDQPPDVSLAEPATDLVLASGAGRVTIRATAADDYGVGDFRLTWSRTRGSGETFEYVDGEWAFASLARSGRSVTGTLALDLATLQLQPGDVLHVRAVARDRNAVTGPGESVSRTRIIRVARPEELDQVNTDVGFPIELPENPVLSQRMLVIRTERLRDRVRGRTVSAGDAREEAADIGHEQGRLRERVGEQIFTRSTGAMQGAEGPQGFTEQGGVPHQHEEEGHEEAEAAKPFSERVLESASAATGQGTLDEVTHAHDDAPILDVDRTLLQIYNAMWAAERELNQARPDSALPHQYLALRLIQELRKAERRFPRGTVRVDAVDVAAARGEGKLDEVAPTDRAAGAALPSVLPLLAELDRAAEGIGRRTARQSSLELSALAARALATPGADPQAAALLSRASADAAAGRASAARDLLRRARARLSPLAGTTARPLPSAADPAAAEYFRRLGRGG